MNLSLLSMISPRILCSSTTSTCSLPRKTLGKGIGPPFLLSRRIFVLPMLIFISLSYLDAQSCINRNLCCNLFSNSSSLSAYTISYTSSAYYTVCAWGSCSYIWHMSLVLPKKSGTISHSTFPLDISFYSSPFGSVVLYFVTQVSPIPIVWGSFSYLQCSSYNSSNNPFIYMTNNKGPRGDPCTTPENWGWISDSYIPSN